MQEEQIKINLVEDEFFDVIVNNQLEIHIRRNDIGYSVDLYKYVPQENMQEDHAFDDDFISGCTALDDDFEV